MGTCKVSSGRLHVLFLAGSAWFNFRGGSTENDVQAGLYYEKLSSDKDRGLYSRDILLPRSLN